MIKKKRLRFVTVSFLIAIMYILFALYLFNYQLVWESLVDTSSVFVKVKLLISLIAGLWTAFSALDSTILIITAFLVGMNIAISTQLLHRMRNQGRIKLAVGGGGILGIALTGCSACGFSILSLLGLGASFSTLPFRGLELRMLTIALLTFSLSYSVKKLQKKPQCDR